MKKISYNLLKKVIILIALVYLLMHSSHGDIQYIYANF